MWLLLVGLIGSQAGAAAPTLSAAPNPVAVPQGQTEAQTTITWDAGDYAYGEVYYTTDGANQQLLGKNQKGTAPLTVKLGSAYHVWMVIYPGGNAFKVVAELDVKTDQGAAPSPSRPAQGPRPAPVQGISKIQVIPGAHSAIVTFDAVPGQVPFAEFGTAAPLALADGTVRFDPRDVVKGYEVGGDKAGGHYRLDLTDLVPFHTMTSYWYILHADDGAGRHLYPTGQFTTRSQSVAVVWDHAYVMDDSDPFGSGEINFWFWANFGQPGAQGWSAGRWSISDKQQHDLGHTLFIDKAPDEFVLSASGADKDKFGGDFVGGLPDPTYGPRDTGDYEYNGTRATFDLSGFPGGREIKPFEMWANGSDGDLTFIVYGRLEISDEHTGTTSSALTAAPPIWETTPLAPPGPAFYTNILYGLRPDGTLAWYRKDGMSYTEGWHGPRKVGQGWNLKQIIPGGGNVLYGITQDGKLLWFQHRDFDRGAGVSRPPAADQLVDPAVAPVTVNRGGGVGRKLGGGDGNPALPGGVVFNPADAGAWSGPTLAGTSYTSWGLLAPAPVSDTKGFSGHWDVDWHSGKTATHFDMKLKSSDGKVEGSYGAGDGGTVQGTVTGNELNATWRWKNGDTGVLQFSLAADGSFFTGHWRYGAPDAGGAWQGEENGRRATSPGGPASSGWDAYKSVFGGGDGVLYAITQDGRLLWFRHDGFFSGPSGPLEGPKEVGQNWGQYRLVFSAGGGYIYAVDAAGKLWWFHHLGLADGSPRWAVIGGAQAVQVGEGWGNFKQVFSAGAVSPGVMPGNLTGAVTYAVDGAGKLWYFDHIWFENATTKWVGPKLVGQGWGDYSQAMAMIPITLTAGSIH